MSRHASFATILVAVTALVSGCVPGLAAELAVGCAAVKAALGQQLLQLEPLGAGQFALLPRPRLHEGLSAA